MTDRLTGRRSAAHSIWVKPQQTLFEANRFIAPEEALQRRKSRT
jgi:hypothetical protein